jgi:S1-C subfamily serine protease
MKQISRLAGLPPAVVLAAVVAWSGPGRAQKLTTEPQPVPSGLLQDELNTIEVFRRVSPAVVNITNKQLRRDIFTLNVLEIPRGTGSGFVWDRDGHIVTNAHVIAGGNAFSVTFSDGTSYDAKLVGQDPTKDLAVLRIEAPRGGLVPVVTGTSQNLVVGQKVLAIGNPFGLDQSLTTGVISALGREITSVAGTPVQDVIQTDASINPGNSGGPLLDSGGRLIGVNTMIYSTSGSSAGIGFAVPVATVMRIVPQLIREGRVTRAGLGITIFPDYLTQRWDVEGVPIRDVVRGSAAARAGLQGAEVDSWGRVRFGDIIVGIDGQTIENYAEMYTALDRHQPGDRVKVRYRRGERTRETDVTLQEVGE